MPPRKAIADSVIDLSFPDPNSGCWYWCGSIDKDGYSKLRRSTGHKASYEAFVGPVPNGMEVDHKCRNRACVNPNHLQTLTHAANVARGDYTTNHRNRVKTRCKRGHELNEANTHRFLVDGSPRRKCRVCDREKKRIVEALYGVEIVEVS